MSTPHVAVVGAGMAGAACARALAAAGWRVTVFDKGRGPGGRCATRRVDGFRFDHGAQYFTARDPGFVERVEAWRRNGAVAEWSARIRVVSDRGVTETDGSTRRYVGVPGMSAMARDLLAGLDVRLGVEIAALTPTGDGWQVAASESPGRFSHVAVTAPAPQAAALLAAAPALAARAAAARLSPCWALLAGFAAPPDADFDAAFVNDGPLRWVARSDSKPGRDGSGESWVAHAGPEWSAARLERQPDAMVPLLAEAFAALMERPLPRARHLSAHRWRFALPDPPLAERCLYDAAARIGGAGDWCGGPRVEGAFLSGRALAAAMLAG